MTEVDEICLRNLIKKCLHEVLDEREDAALASPKLEEVHTIRHAVRATVVRSDPHDPLFVDLEPGQYVLLGVKEIEGEEHALIRFPDGTERLLVICVGINDTQLGAALFGD